MELPGAPARRPTWLGIAITLAGALLTAGCHPPAIDAPSLSPRPIEHQPVALPDVASEAETPPAEGLQARLDTIVAAVEAAHLGFERERGAAAAALHRPGAEHEGSESWVVAQQALSALDAAQGPVRDRAAEIDALRQDPANHGTGGRRAIDAAAAKVEALSAAEAQAMAALSPR